MEMGAGKNLAGWKGPGGAEPGPRPAPCRCPRPPRSGSSRGAGAKSRPSMAGPGRGSQRRSGPGRALRGRAAQGRGCGLMVLRSWGRREKAERERGLPAPRPAPRPAAGFPRSPDRTARPPISPPLRSAPRFPAAPFRARSAAAGAPFPASPGRRSRRCAVRNFPESPRIRFSFPSRFPAPVSLLSPPHHPSFFRYSRRALPVLLPFPAANPPAVPAPRCAARHDAAALPGAPHPRGAVPGSISPPPGRSFPFVRCPPLGGRPVRGARRGIVLGGGGGGAGPIPRGGGTGAGRAAANKEGERSGARRRDPAAPPERGRRRGARRGEGSERKNVRLKITISIIGTE